MTFPPARPTITSAASTRGTSSSTRCGTRPVSLEQGGFTTGLDRRAPLRRDLGGGWLGFTSPNPLMLGQDLAAHTDTLRIGQCGVILPDWHPLRVARGCEPCWTISAKGRSVDFGVAFGVMNSRASPPVHPDADRRDRDRSYALVLRIPRHRQEMHGLTDAFHLFGRVLPLP